jgi:hypothetical protein
MSNKLKVVIGVIGNSYFIEINGAEIKALNLSSISIAL